VLEEAEELLFVFAEAAPDPEVAPPAAVVVADAGPPADPPEDGPLAPPAVAAAV